MKERFFEILDNYLNDYGLKRKDLKSRKRPIPSIKYYTITDFYKEYPNAPVQVVAEFLGCNHSTITHYRNYFKPEDKQRLNILDFSSFVSFGYPKKIRFTHKYV